LANKIETRFYKIYQDQRTSGDLALFLLAGDHHFDGNLVEVDARFSKSRRWLNSQNESVRANFRLACDVLDIEPCGKALTSISGKLFLPIYSTAATIWMAAKK